MSDHPAMITKIDQIEPVPRRIRALVGGSVVLDTTDALYVWESPYYPQYYIPSRDVAVGALEDENHSQRLKRGTARRQTLRVGDLVRPESARIYGEDAKELEGYVRFEWNALDAWYEEDEEIFVHPRSPYVRVDALRSTRSVRVEFEGVKLAETTSPVLLFETGLTTRYYINRTDVDFGNLIASDTETACPYKGRTTGYWSVRAGDGEVHRDLAWSYDFPTAGLASIAGLIAFYNEKLDIFVDGRKLPRG